jgi:capsular polysaccharide biosynthesis protein
MRTLTVSLGSLLKRGSARVSNQRTYGVVHSIWTAGYYHWITESLPRALVMNSLFPEAIPILPSAKYKSYESSLKALGFHEISYFPEGKNAILTNPVVTDCPRQFATTDPELLRQVRYKVKIGLDIVNHAKPYRLIYVSRRKARGRYVVNEEKIVNFLSAIGFESVCFEDFTFEEQVRLMHETTVLISIHGAALTNMVFMQPGGRIIELLPIKNGIFDYNVVRNSLRHDPCFVRLAKAMGHDHIGLECKPEVAKFTGTHMSNINVNITELSSILDQKCWQ